MSWWLMKAISYMQTKSVKKSSYQQEKEELVSPEEPLNMSQKKCVQARLS